MQPMALPDQFASSAGVRRRMQAQPRRNTWPELALRRALYRLGVRGYRVHRRPVPEIRRQADLVFTKARVAVFVDGCFWHGCPDHGRRAHNINQWYWPEKIARNKTRDADTDVQLKRHGWLAIRIWEHEDSEAAARRVARSVRRRVSSAKRSPPWLTQAGE